MAEDFPTKPLDQSVIFNARTDKIDNTSDLTKSQNGNPIGERIRAVSANVTSLTTRVTNAEAAIAAGGNLFESWSGTGGLQSSTLPLGSSAVVLDKDTGTHTDPVTGATVSNAGKYVRQTGGWKWLQPTDAAIAADTVASGITPATAAQSLLFSLAMIDDTGKFRKLSSTERDLLFQGIVMPKTYPVTLENQVVSDQPHVLLGTDTDRHSVTVQCYDADITFTPGTGRNATFDGSTASIKQAAGELKTYTEFGDGPWSFAAKQPEGGSPVTLPVPLFITMGRLTASYTAPSLTADDRLQFLPDSVDPRWRAAATAAFDMLDDSNNPNQKTLNKLLFIKLSGASAANNAINMGNPFAQKTMTYNGGITTTPYLGDKGDGSTGWIGTRVRDDDLLQTINGSFIMVKPSDVSISDGVLMGNHQSNSVSPNRTSTLAAIKANAGGQDTTTAAAGKAVAVNRASSAGYDVYVDGLFTETKTRTSTIDSNLEYNLLATNTTAGGLFASPSTTGLDWVVMGPNLQSASTIKKIYDAMMLITNANIAIRANP